MNRFKTFSIALAATFLFASCGDDTTPVSTPANGNYKGTVSVAPDTDNAFTLSGIEVKFTPAENGAKADVEMLKVKFAAAMPFELDMLISGVTLTPTADGYSISGTDIVPTALAGQSFPQYTITDLTGTVTTTSLSFDMHCGSYPVTFTGTRASSL
jgi:hypothetical protein